MASTWCIRCSCVVVLVAVLVDVVVVVEDAAVVVAVVAGERVDMCDAAEPLGGEPATSPADHAALRRGSIDAREPPGVVSAPLPPPWLLDVDGEGGELPAVGSATSPIASRSIATRTPKHCVNSCRNDIGDG